MIPRRLIHLDETVLGVANLGDDVALCDAPRLGIDADSWHHPSLGVRRAVAVAVRVGGVERLRHGFIPDWGLLDLSRGGQALSLCR